MSFLSLNKLVEILIKLNIKLIIKTHFNFESKFDVKKSLFV